jgi:hypothetical protein
MDASEIFLDVVLVLFLFILIAGAICSVWYTISVVQILISGSEDEEEVASIMDQATQTPTTTQTPVFGEIPWYFMVAKALFLLTCRAGWQNSSKVVMQFEWTSEDNQASAPLITLLIDSAHFLFSAAARALPQANLHLCDGADRLLRLLPILRSRC